MTTTEKIEKTNSSSFINKLASNPKIFIFLRRCLEFNFVGERKVINREFNELNSNSPILDLGCGTGEFSEFFNPEVYLGIDINKDYIDFASNNYPHKFKVMDANHLEFDTNSFENIFVFGVFHHLPDNQVFKIMEENLEENYW